MEYEDQAIQNFILGDVQNVLDQMESFQNGS